MRLLLSLIFVISTSFSAHAVVDMKNAAFSDYWVDMMIPGNNYLLKVSRYYSSRSLFSGIFGFGWCSNLETRLDVTMEGNLILTECGTSSAVFYPANYNTSLIGDAVDKIIAALKQKNPAKGKKFYDDLKISLLTDYKLRSQMAAEAGFKIMPTRNTAYLANGRDSEKIIYDGGGYVRNLADGSSERFDNRGKLVQFTDKNRSFLKLTYSNDLPSQIIDNQGRKITLAYSLERKVRSISGPSGLNTSYKFNGENLVSVTNAWKNTYTYAYDSGHNLTRINLPDGTFKAISYNEAKDWVKDFKDRDGCFESYEFTLSEDNPKDHYWSTASRTCKGKLIFKSRYEFWYQMRPDREKYLSRVLTVKNGEELDISYHQDFPKPISIRKNADITTYHYLASGLVRQKTVSLLNASAEDSHKYTLSFSYDGNNKIDEATTDYFNKSGKLTRRRKTQFKYDAGGRLNLARTSDGQFVEIKYNNMGLISAISDQAKKEVLIEYDPKTLKPTSIVRPSVGSIQLAYSSSGELKKLQNKGGSTVGAQVYAAFNNFLDMVGPVSSELSLNL